MKFYCLFLFLSHVYLANSNFFSFEAKDIQCYHNINLGVEAFHFEKTPIDRRYFLIENLVNNTKENYLRWLARDMNNGKFVFVKVNTII